MLKSIDVLIGLVVIMSVLSLLITIVTQMVSAALSMRGKNLANALAVTLRTVDPRIDQHAEALVHYILTRPVISDSIWSRTTAVPASMDGNHEIAAAEEIGYAEGQLGLSQNAVDSAKARLKQVEEQWFRAVAELKLVPQDRRPAVEELIEKIRAEYAEATRSLKLAQVAARDIAVRIAELDTPMTLEKPRDTDRPRRDWRVWVPFSGLHLPTAVRSDEVYRILNEIAGMSPMTAVGSGLSAFAPRRVRNLLKILGVPGEMASEAETKISDALKLLESGGADGANEVVENVKAFREALEVASAQAFDRFQAWFESGQNRAQQWFATHSRVVTIILSIIAALLLQLDVSEIYRRLSSDSVVRNKLIENADAFIRKGEGILSQQDPLVLALSDFREKHSNLRVDDPTVQTRTAYLNAIESAATAGQTAGSGATAPDQLEKEFDSLLEKRADEVLKNGSREFRGVIDQLEQTGFDLVPNGWRWSAPDSFFNHIFGMLLMAALLSIGAPFWFNVLKTLTNLRPALAQIVDNKPRQTTTSAQPNEQ